MFHLRCRQLSALLFLSCGLAAAQPAPDSWESLMKAGDAARKAREYKKADTLYQAGLEAARKQGPSNTNIATTLVALASMYEEAGNHSQIEILYKLAVAIDEKGQGKEHPAVAARLSALAQYYENRARYADAEPLLKRAVAIGVNSPGAEKTDLAKVLVQYASVLRKLNRNEEAAKLTARAATLRGR